jgi:hypothetical protein
LLVREHCERVHVVTAAVGIVRCRWQLRAACSDALHMQLNVSACSGPRREIVARRSGITRACGASRAMVSLPSSAEEWRSSVDDAIG